MRRSTYVLMSLATAAALFAASRPWASRHQMLVAADDPAATSTPTSEEPLPMVNVKVFNKAGKLVGPFSTPKVVKSEEQWKAQLTPQQYEVVRSKGTERPFCGNLLDNKIEGVYSCVACGLPLFSSDSKFHSGSGWPSFFQPITKENLIEHRDHSHGMSRTEIVCTRCDGHLGHVFEDGPRPTGLRFCLNSESLVFTPNDSLASLADPLAESAGAEKTKQPSEQKLATVVVAGGCFWCTESAFAQLSGVTDVQSGYTGGQVPNPTYQQVCTGNTGHAEAIRITYDPTKISYDQLLSVFFDAHDPTQLNAQGADVGTQYRSAIFFTSPQEKAAAEAKIQKLNAKLPATRPIVTTLEPLREFYPAEAYHQNYADLNPDNPYIQSVSVPKTCKIRQKYSDLIAPDK